MKIFQLIYRSKARFYFSDEHLVALLHKARQHNSSKGITGLLLYGYGQFIQILEGDEKQVKSLYYNHISLDARHEDLVLLQSQFIEKRAFSDWAMAFRPLNAEKLTQIEGYLNPIQTDENTDSQKDLLAPLRLLELMQHIALTDKEPF
jgi:Sensors of blue-light using FAD